MKLITPEELASLLARPRPVADSAKLIKEAGGHFRANLRLYTHPLIQPPFYLATLPWSDYLVDMRAGRSVELPYNSISGDLRMPEFRRAFRTLREVLVRRQKFPNHAKSIAYITEWLNSTGQETK